MKHLHIYTYTYALCCVVLCSVVQHADWDGLTVADLLFPWFMWMMGVSMALSFESLRISGMPLATMWRKVVVRSLTLFAIGMFLANGYELSTWRVPGACI